MNKNVCLSMNLKHWFFSDTSKLANNLRVEKSVIDNIITECSEPERINNAVDTAPSKRLEKLSKYFKKTSTGITIAQDIGIDKMREQCPVFNEWLTAIEGIRHLN